MAGATSCPSTRSPRPLSDAVSARRSRRRWCCAFREVRCPTWFQPAARSFYGHLVSSASGKDCVCAGTLHPLTRARAALVWCTWAARRGASDSPLRGAHSTVLLVFTRTLLPRALHDACVSARRSARSARLCGTVDLAATRRASVARRRDVPSGAMRAASVSDSRARRHSFRLWTDTRDVCSGAW